MTFEVWLAYALAMLIISISPGSGCINPLSSSLSYGFRPAISAIAALQVRLLVRLMVVGISLGAILVTSPSAFLIL